MLYNYYTFYFQNISSLHKESLHSLRGSFQSSTKFSLSGSSPQSVQAAYLLALTHYSPQENHSSILVTSSTTHLLPSATPWSSPPFRSRVFLRSSLNLTPVAPNRQCLSSLVEKAMAPHSSTLAWRIPWTEEPGGLQSKGSRRVVHDWVTSLSLFTFMHWRRTWQPTPVFLPGESEGWGSLVGRHLWGRRESDTTEAT